MNEADFEMLDESIRGEVPEGLFKQITLTFNPWNEKHWIKRRFFDSPSDPDIMAKTTNYQCNDPSALFCGLVDLEKAEIYVFDEMYERGLTNKAIHAKIQGMGYGKERIKADSAEPKSIDELRELGLQNIRPARKGKDSINNGIQYIQGFKIYIHPRCVNFLTEIGNYTWNVDKTGTKLNKPIDDFNHLLDAMRYALEDFLKGETFSFE